MLKITKKIRFCSLLLHPSNMIRPLSFYFLLFAVSCLLFSGCAYYPTVPKIEKVEKHDGFALKGYLVGPEDVLNIVVWDHKDLTRKVQVSREGDFSYPLVGKVKADKLTISQLEKEITQRLSGRYIVNPQVTVTVEEYHRFFYIFGEVKNPGKYPLETELTVLKAITIAGGATEKASINKTKIVREKEDVRKEIKAKMGDMIKSEDVIIVPESFF